MHHQKFNKKNLKWCIKHESNIAIAGECLTSWYFLIFWFSKTTHHQVPQSSRVHCPDNRGMSINVDVLAEFLWVEKVAVSLKSLGLRGPNPSTSWAINTEITLAWGFALFGFSWWSSYQGGSSILASRLVFSPFYVIQN